MKSVQKQCETILERNNNNKNGQNVSVQERKNRIKSMIDGIIKCTDNECYDSKSILGFLSNSTKLISMRWEPETLMNHVQIYGKIRENVDNPLVLIPKINLEMPSKTQDCNDGYKIKMKWSVVSASNLNNLCRSFIIRYKKIENESQHKNGNNFEDEEKQILLKAEDIENGEWVTANYNVIKPNKDDLNTFSVDILDKFEYNYCYKYQVVLKLNEPIDLMIESNNIDLTVTNVVKIELQQYQQRAHYDSDSYHPRQMLNNAAVGYGSALVQDFKPNEQDWVIFKLKDGENLYFPKKFIIKSFGNGQSVKTMRIYIGDNDKNKWYLFEPNVINVKKNNQYQLFEIDGIDPALIKMNELRQIKLEFVTNHGCSSGCKFFIYEFQLYGIKI